MFLTSRYPNGIYSILVNSCKIDAERKLNKKLKLKKINLKKNSTNWICFKFFFIFDFYKNSRQR